MLFKKISIFKEENMQIKYWSSFKNIQIAIMVSLLENQIIEKINEFDEVKKRGRSLDNKTYQIFKW